MNPDIQNDQPSPPEEATRQPIRSSLAIIGNDRDHSLPPEIQDLVQEIQGYAKEFGLDFFPGPSYF